MGLKSFDISQKNRYDLNSAGLISLALLISVISISDNLTSLSQTFLLLTCSMNVIFFLLRGSADGVVDPPGEQEFGLLYKDRSK